MALRVVFDTSVVFSAVGWGGRPYQCLESARSGSVISVTCPELLTELIETLVRKRGMPAIEADEIAEEFASFSELVHLSEILKLVRDDPDDDVVIACAVEAKANLIVTGDRHLLSLERLNSIDIVRPLEFLTRLQITSSQGDRI